METTTATPRLRPAILAEIALCQRWIEIYSSTNQPISSLVMERSELQIELEHLEFQYTSHRESQMRLFPTSVERVQHTVAVNLKLGRIFEMGVSYDTALILAYRS